MFTSTPNSRFFNPCLWRSARLALMFENGRKGVGVAKVGGSVNRLKALRFDTKVEEQKVVNVATPVVVAKALNLTVKALRALAKARGLSGYSKLRKAELETLLA